MKTTRAQNLLTAALVGTLAFSATDSRAAEPAPRLILQITVDQLRGDLPGRYLKNMGDGGWRYLMDHGIWYADAHHAHANTETIVGHTTLATGADPAAHGMIGNVWLDRLTGTLTYNIEDPKYHTLTPGSGVNKATEIDPTQKVAKSDGRSPAAILVSTFSDELAIHTAGRAKIFGVSVKDRGAVSMAGHAGKAFWFSKASGEFVTSSYYYDRYPAWVDAFNQRKLPATYDGKSWELMHEKSTYLFGDADDQPWEMVMPGYGRVFPHPYGPATGKYFTTFLTLSPAGDDLTLAFAKALIDAEQIGQDEVTDYLSVSFSSTDYIGHLFSPSSLEVEDNQLRLDRTLADLFAYVEKRVGLKNTLIVLSADHGGPEASGYLNALGIPAKYVNPEQWDKEPGIAALKKKFGVGKELIQSYRHPYVYLNREVIQKKGLDIAVVEKAVVEELTKLDGVALAVSSTALREGNVPNTRLTQAVLRNFNPRRSGDIFVVFEPHCFINDFDGLIMACTHGAPWRYDTFVPVVFAGGNLTGQRVYRPIDFLVVADHAENFGLAPAIAENNPELLKSAWGLKIHDLVKVGTPESIGKAFNQWVDGVNSLKDPLAEQKGLAVSMWAKATAAAEKYNEPGCFTAFIGFEWTLMPNGNNLHRNVIFRDGKDKADQVLPFSVFDSQDPEDLWKWMGAYEQKTGGRMMAIPHNGNLSNGQMFDDVTLTTKKPLNRDYAERRMRWEPIYEVTQIKGDGETHPLLSPNDELANFERWDKATLGPVPKTPDMLPREMAREALKRGLGHEAKFGVNPFKFGMIGSSDSHTALATTEENNFFGKVVMLEPTADPIRFEEVIAGRIGPVGHQHFARETSASGLAAVWARENTREALWDSMPRKEVYATTGTRLIVRVFGGFDFSAADLERSDFAEHGYQGGVPMGGDLKAAPAGKAPVVPHPLDA